VSLLVVVRLESGFDFDFDCEEWLTMGCKLLNQPNGI